MIWLVPVRLRTSVRLSLGKKRFRVKWRMVMASPCKSSGTYVRSRTSVVGSLVTW